MFVIRKVAVGDVDALQELYMKHLTQYPPQEPQDIGQWKELLQKIADDPDYYLLVGDLDGQIVSSVTLVVVKNLTHNLRPYAVMENVVTHADYRHNGYASALIEKASQIAKECGCYKIMLMTGSKRESTLRFYERCGFNMHEKTAFLKRL